MKPVNWRTINPRALRAVAEMLDLFDDALQVLIPFAPGNTPEQKQDALDCVNSNQMQTAIRLWADEMENHERTN